ncbi:MAG: hypothetical protein J6T53_07580 [Bacteroidales bacterium]|nr:hypothetical protein [Bacteroidales bacterium]
MKNHISKITIFFAAIIMVLLVSCNRPKYNVYCYQNEQGFNEIMLIKGDTIGWNFNQYMEGKYYHYHKGDTIVTHFVFSGDSWIHGTVISGHISDYIQDDSFLLADKKPLDSILGKYIRIVTKNNNVYSRREYDTINKYGANVKMLEESPIHQYWIIVKTTADVYGPFSYEDYLKMKKELGVPETLKLKREKQ